MDPSERPGRGRDLPGRAHRLGRLQPRSAEHRRRDCSTRASSRSLPFTLLGPFVGVFIDRWSRREILTIAPAVEGRLRAAGPVRPGAWPTVLVLPRGARRPVDQPVLARGRVGGRAAPGACRRPADGELDRDGRRHAGAARRRVPRRQDRRHDRLEVSVLLIATLAWLVASLVAGRIRSDLAPMTLPRDPPSCSATRSGASSPRRRTALDDGAHAARDRADRVDHGRSDRAGHHADARARRVPRAARRRASASFSNVIGAGGVGVLLGIATAGSSRTDCRRSASSSLGVPGRWDRVLIGGLDRIRRSGDPARGCRARADVRLEEGLGRHDGAGVPARRIPRPRVLGLRLLLQHGPADRRGVGHRDDPGAQSFRHDGRGRCRLPRVDAGAARDRVATPADRPATGHGAACRRDWSGARPTSRSRCWRRARSATGCSSKTAA